jgi:hypothetical protein
MKDVMTLLQKDYYQDRKTFEIAMTYMKLSQFWNT